VWRPFGSLLAGVAHELNNPLSIVIGNALLLAEGTEGSALAERARRVQAAAERCGRIVRNALEKRLIEALKSVDAHGDVAPAHIHDPMTMLLRENAVQTYLMRWDDGRGRFVLTGTGRRRISAGSRAPGAVVSFRNR
jgi:signal transduction histidine kinase